MIGGIEHHLARIADALEGKRHVPPSARFLERFPHATIEKAEPLPANVVNIRQDPLNTLFEMLGNVQGSATIIAEADIIYALDWAIKQATATECARAELSLLHQARAESEALARNLATARKAHGELLKERDRLRVQHVRDQDTLARCKKLTEPWQNERSAKKRIEELGVILAGFYHPSDPGTISSPTQPEKETP